MTTDEIIEEVLARSGNRSLSPSEILVKANAEYSQTNLSIINLNEDYFLTEKSDFAVTSSRGPYTLPDDFGKIRGLWTPTDTFVRQRRPTDRTRSSRYGWYFSGVTSAALKRISFTDTPDETGNYLLQYVAFPTPLLTGGSSNPLWPVVFHEILILGSLERIYSVQDELERYADIRAAKQDLKDSLLSQVGGLNLGISRQVIDSDDDID